MKIHTYSTNQQVNSPLFQNWEESSLYRKIRAVVSKILCDMWVTALSYFCKVNIKEGKDYWIKESSVEETSLGDDSEHEYEISDFSFTGQVQQNPRATVSELANTRSISPSTLENYGIHLEETNKGNFQFYTGGLFPETNIALPQKKQETRLLAVPVVIKGIEDHIVTFVVDFEKGRIEFYDSKGLTIEDRGQEKLLSKGSNGETLTLQTVVEQMKEKYGITTVVQNIRALSKFIELIPSCKSQLLN